MAYNMKRGNSAVPFKELGSSPAKQKTKIDPDAPGTPGKPGYEPPVPSMDYLTKTPNPTTKAVHDFSGADQKSRDKADIGQKQDFSISNLHKDTKMSLNKKPSYQRANPGKAKALKKMTGVKNKKKHPLGIEDPAELKKLYKTTENPNNKRRQ